MQGRLARASIVILMAALISAGTVVASLARSSYSCSTDKAALALQQSGISMGEPRDMVDAEWDNVPLAPARALAFSVGDLVGCYGCEDPMGYLLQYENAVDLERDWELAQANVHRSYAADWLWRYSRMIVILPAGLTQRQADAYRAVLEDCR